MVRFKNRYLVVEIAHTDGRAMEERGKERAVLDTLRESLRDNFGDVGLGRALGGLSVRYVDAVTGVCFSPDDDDVLLTTSAESAVSRENAGAALWSVGKKQRLFAFQDPTTAAAGLREKKKKKRARRRVVPRRRFPRGRRRRARGGRAAPAGGLQQLPPRLRRDAARRRGPRGPRAAPRAAPRARGRPAGHAGPRLCKVVLRVHQP